ncbi:MAG: DNA alkylation repair protein [Deltaproteobacteria bacterium]|nr:DNA alkylation repair protein [Deltaproteobacteria bacterium]
MNGKLLSIQNELRKLGNKKTAEHSQRFFRTGEGKYGEGDRFLGVRVLVLRKLARKYQGVSIEEASRLLKSQFREERLLSLLMLINIFKKTNEWGKI